MRLPQQLLLVYSGKAERTAPYQYGNLLQSRSCTHYEVIKAAEVAVFVSVRRNNYSQPTFQMLKAVKTQIDFCSPYRCFRFAPVDAGKMDTSPCLSGFVDV